MSAPAFKIDPPLAEADPEMYELLERERTRQFKGLELIASENFTSTAVMEVLGSHLTNKYSEGLPGARYYGGNEFIDQIEQLCQRRALAAFGLDPNVWGVNVQPYSGSPANLAAYTALLQPHDRIMGLALSDGGHLTHGFYRGHKKISATSVYFESMPYHVDAVTGYIDYARMESVAADYCPKLLVCGGSAYPREWDYKRMRALADSCGALFMCDMAHISGLVAGKVVDSPFEYAHVVTSTTHKTLRGPRSGIIFYRKDKPKDMDLETLINNAVFPGCQGGPHNNAIGALAVQLKEVCSPAWPIYAQQIKANAAALGRALVAGGQKLVTDGTDNHLVLWDLRPVGLTGSKMEALCDACAITVNKNTIHGDKSALTPGGIRLGAPALTSRGFVEADFEQVAAFLLRALAIALEVQAGSGKKLDEFKKALIGRADCAQLRHDVEAFASRFSMPGMDPSKLKFQ